MEQYAAETNLLPEEYLLQGLWIDTGSRMEKDSTWQRILWLVAEQLESLAESPDGRLFRDPVDGRLWELLRTRPDLPDGGPPVLRVIAKEKAAGLYRVDL